MSVIQLDPVTIVKIIALSPLLVGVIGVIGLWPFWRWPPFSHGLGYLTFIASAISLALSMALVLEPPPKALMRTLSLPAIGKVGFLIDALSIYFILLVNLIAFFASWSSFGFLKDRVVDKRQQSPTFFHTLVNLFHFTMLLVPLVNNLIALWIAIEATTLVSTLLVSFQDKKDSWEAAWKYLIITSTGIIFALLGTMFLANAAKDLIGVANGQNDPNSIMNWSFLLDHAGRLSPDFVKLSFLFILVGYGTKAGFAPMHTWLPDGHGEAPAPISALLSGVLLKSALYAILRFYTITNAALGSTTFTSRILLGSGLLSLLIATPFILKEKNRFKRVLAYHSLEHMGIITFGIGIGGTVALFGALLHTLNHAVTKSLMFLSFGDIMQRYEQVAKDEGREFDQKEIRGVLRSMPWTGAILTLGGLALVGTPPFNIFMSEFIILWGAINRLWEKPTSIIPLIPDWFIITAIIIFMLSTTLIFYGLVGHLSRLVLHAMPNERRLKERFWSDLLPLFLLAIMVVVFGLWVIPPLSSLLSESVKIVLRL